MKTATRHRKDDSNHTYERANVTIGRKIFKVFFVAFYELQSGTTCGVCGTYCEGFRHGIRVITIWNARTKVPILGASDLGKAVEVRLNQILMSEIVGCRSHIGVLEERRRKRYHLSRDVST